MSLQFFKRTFTPLIQQQMFQFLRFHREGKSIKLFSFDNIIVHCLFYRFGVLSIFTDSLLDFFLRLCCVISVIHFS